MSSIVNKIKDAVSGDNTNSRTAATHNTTTTMGSGAREGEYGPHGSRIANALDPRVDSDRDGSAGGLGGTTRGTTTGGGLTGGTTGGTTTGGGLTGRHTGGGLTGGTTTGGGAREGEYGPHSSRIANALDPRVDSDRDGSRTMNPGVGTGPAPNTAGPHRSDMANKLDPRVDSDMDGSGTMGNNRTLRS